VIILNAYQSATVMNLLILQHTNVKHVKQKYKIVLVVHLMGPYAISAI